MSVLISGAAHGRPSRRRPTISTITCASPETLDAAPSQPERYDLLRVRMGGWSELFSAMFPESQQQHLRRPIAASEERERPRAARARMLGDGVEVVDVASTDDG